MTAKEDPFSRTGELVATSMALALDREKPAINPADRCATPLHCQRGRAMERMMAESDRRAEETAPETNEGAAPNRRDGSAVPKYERLKGTTAEVSRKTGRDEPDSSGPRSTDSPWMGGG